MEFTNEVERRLYEVVDSELPELQKLLYFIFVERGQLYGALSRLMNETGIYDFHVDREDAIASRKNFMVYMTPDEDKEGYSVILKERNAFGQIIEDDYE